MSACVPEKMKGCQISSSDVFFKLVGSRKDFRKVPFSSRGFGKKVFTQFAFMRSLSFLWVLSPV